MQREVDVRYVRCVRDSTAAVVMMYRVLLNRTVSAQRRCSHWPLTLLVIKLGGYTNTRTILHPEGVIELFHVALRGRKQSVVVVVDVVESKRR